MSLTRQIAHNTFIQVIARATSMLLGLIAVGVMTRYLGQAGFGQYTTIVAFLQFFGIIVDFGLTIIVVQLISAQPARTNKLVSNIFTLRVLAAIVFYAVGGIVVWAFPYPAIIKWGVAVTSGALFFNSLNQIVVGLFQRELKMARAAVSEVVGRAAILIGVIAVVSLEKGLLPIMGAVVLGNFINFVVSFFFSRDIAKIRLAFDWSVWKEVLGKSWPVGISMIFNLVYFRLDTVVLSLYRSQAEVGIYGAPYKVLESLSAFPYMFMGLILPLLATAWAKENKEKFLATMQKSWDFMAAITLPMVAGGVVLATPIMLLVAGEGFTDSGPVFKILVVATGMIYLSVVFNHAIVALDLQRKMLWGFAGVAVASIVGYLVFIPLYSYWAAAVITVVTEAMILVISVSVVWRRLRKLVALGVFYKAVICSALMGLLLWCLNLAGVGLLALLIIGAGVYVVLMYLLRGLKKELIKEVVGRA